MALARSREQLRITPTAVTMLLVATEHHTPAFVHADQALLLVLPAARPALDRRWRAADGGHLAGQVVLWDHVRTGRVNIRTPAGKFREGRKVS